MPILTKAQQRTHRLKMAAAENAKLDTLIAAINELKCANTASAYTGDDYQEERAERAALLAAYDSAFFQYDELYERAEEIGEDEPETGLANFGVCHPDHPSYAREVAA